MDTNNNKFEMRDSTGYIAYTGNTTSDGMRNDSHNFEQAVHNDMLYKMKAEITALLGLTPREMPYPAISISGILHRYSLVYEIGNTWSIFSTNKYKTYLSIIPRDPSLEVFQHQHMYNGRCVSAREFKIILNLLDIL